MSYTPFMNIANTLKIDRNSKIAFTIHIYYKLRNQELLFTNTNNLHIIYKCNDNGLCNQIIYYDVNISIKTYIYRFKNVYE